MIASDPRSDTAKAERALVELEAAEVAASAAVDATREEAAMGRAKLGDVLRAQRLLAKAQDAVELGRARIRAVAREVEAARLASQAAREDARRAAVRELEPEREALAQEVAAFLRYAVNQANNLDRKIAAFNDRAAPIRAPQLAQMSSWGMAWMRFQDGAQKLLSEIRIAYRQR